MNIEEMLQAYKNGNVELSDVMQKLKVLPFDDIQYAMVDYHRELRAGCPEVIYCEGKTPEQINGIVKNMRSHGEGYILATRANEAAYRAAFEVYPEAVYHAQARLVTIELEPREKRAGEILVATAGTSDIPVAEEAAITAEFLGNRVNRLYDVGVAGLHRVLSRLEVIQRARVLIVVAGMEGALASVIGGLTDKPVIAVPTSIGYGANLGGLAALLSMLNSCASGVGVVNIDNGFGAGMLANNINKMGNV